jgi:hypothetical protein
VFAAASLLSHLRGQSKRLPKKLPFIGAFIAIDTAHDLFSQRRIKTF